MLKITKSSKTAFEKNPYGVTSNFPKRPRSFKTSNDEAIAKLVNIVNIAKHAF